MTPKKLLTELDEREREFHTVTDIVKTHREASKNKNVWITRNGEMLREDLEDARTLPGIKESLDQFDENPQKHQQSTLSTLFSAAEGVSRAKTLTYFEEVKSMKESLRELARLDEENGTETVIKCGGQKGFEMAAGGDGEAPAAAEGAGVQNLVDAVEQLDLSVGGASGGNAGQPPASGEDADHPVSAPAA